MHDTAAWPVPGRLSILAVDQGIEHSAALSFAATRRTPTR
jgi:DhnA family fructose-bisphosphate aldolase class Ia